MLMVGFGQGGVLGLFCILRKLAGERGSEV